MKTHFFKRWLVFSFVLSFMCFSPHMILRAQSIANYSFSSSTTGTLEDLSTGSTSLMTGNNDDAASTVNPIGFNFLYMGVSYSHFSANSNGQFQFHTSSGATAIGTNVTPTTGVPNLFPMTGDNEVNNGMRFKVIGSAPNRKLVVEWNQFYVYYTNLTNAGNMQLWLNESNGQIDFVYGDIYNSNNVAVTRSIGIATGTTATTQGSVTVGTSPTYSASATLATNSFAAGSGTATGSPLIANLGTSVEGTRRVYSFTPTAAPNAPSALSFTGVTGTAMTLNWTDNASNELGYFVYRSTDGINYSLVGTLAANAVTYNATGLNFSTLYYWNVVAFNEGSMSTPLSGSQVTTTATLSGTKTVGTGGDYNNLTTAFADINAQGLAGNVDLQLITGYPAAPETYPILSCNAPATGAYTVKVYPTVSGLSITSANATGTLNLNGATNVTFDGRVNQTGAKDLVISNTNAGASYAVQFVNDAKTNALRYLTIHSANTSTTSGTIVFAGSTGTSGNDNNVIDNCDIKDGATTPTNAIYSAGTSTTVDNSGNTVSNSNIYNYFNSASASNGILLASNSAAWTINANKFYQAATRTVTAGSQHRAINIITASANGYVITNNVIGYANATSTGVTTYNGAFAGRFFGIELSAANTGTASSIQGNTISGISLNTTSGSSTTPGIFSGISVLSGTVNIGTVTPNIIGATTGTGAITIVATTTGSLSYGITANSTGTLNIANNTVGAISVNGNAAGVSAGFVGINTTGGSTATSVTGNTIGGATANSIVSGTLGTTTASATTSGITTAGGVTTLTVTGNTINNLTNYSNNTSSVLNGIVSSGSPTTAIISNNTVSNVLLAAGTLTMAGAGSPTTLTSNGNTLFNASVTGASGTIYGMNSGTTQFTYNNNSIHDLAFTANSGASSSVIYGIYNLSSPTVENITNNQIYNLSIAGATTSTSNLIAGVHSNTTSSSVKNFSVNTINGLSFANSSTGTATVNGISTLSGATINIFKNKIYNLSSSGTTSTVNGIITPSGTAVNVYNNVIGDLKAPTASAADPIRGISITSTSTTTVYRVYYNSIYLNATSSGTNFGTSGVYHTVSATATTAALDMRNNIIINESTPAGTGITVAYRRSGAALNNFVATSNRNMLYAGTPSATRLVMYDGTTSYQTMIAYQTAVLPRETNSFTGEAAYTGTGYGTAGNFFISTTPSNANYLKPVAGITTQVESGAANISTPAITDDYSAVIRQGNAGYTGTGTAPDLGAFEFNGTSPAPVITLNSVTPPTATQCTASARLVSVNITTASGTITGATIGYTVNGVAQSNIVMTNTSGTTWEGTIPVPTPANATIAWAVAAQNSIGLNSSYTGTPYSDEPLFGAYATATASSTAVCSGSPSNLSTTLYGLGTAAIGTGATTIGTTSTAEALSPFTQYYEGQHTQYLVLASDLVAAGVQPGALNSIGINVTTKNSTLPYTSLNIKLAPTALTTLANGNNAATFTNVYASSTTVGTGYSTVAGINTFVFGTGSGTTSSFTWDGTSNILVDFCFANDPSSTGTFYSNTDVVAANTKAYTASYGYYADNSSLCGATNANTSSSTKIPNFIFGGIVSKTITSVTWMNGATTVGTGTPLAVSPTTTTTYTANLVASGCSVAPSPTVTVTVNPLPSAPTATNSVQCGVQVPTASVTSTTGASTPTFKWYSASTGGTVMQSSTSTTYTSTVSTTTTFYVAEVNGVTGCESTRTPVTVNVSTPDPVSLTPSSTAICIGQSVTLTAANTGAGFQTYSYTTQSATTGSGAETAVAGASVTVTPTAAGTFTYTLTAVDGGCAASATASVTVNPSPTAVTANSSSATICEGTSVNLTSSATSNSATAPPVNVLSQNFTSGLGTWTTAYSGTAPATTGWAIQNAPFTYSGSMTFNNFATPNGGGFVMSNADMGTSGNKTRAVLTSPSFSTVGYTGATLTFQNLYQRYASGDSLAAVQISIDGGTSWTTLKEYVALAVSQGTVTNNAQVPANESITLGAAYMNQANVKIRYNYVSAWGFYWLLDNINVAATPVDPTSYTWSSNPAGFTSTQQNPTGVAPTTTTTYTMTINNSYGCTGSASTTVTVNHPTTSSTPITACDTYTWTNGTTYNTSGTYTQLLTNAAGCDSTATLVLTINHSTTASVTVTECSSYTWPLNGVTYTASGTHTHVLTNAAGCDSTVTLNLTINMPTTGTDVHTACGSYTWPLNGVTYTSSNNTATHTLVNAAGCDSIVTLDLTINMPTTGTDVQTACGSYTWIDGVTYTSSNNTATHTLMNAAGCDSIVTLDLTINMPTTGTDVQTACTSYTWIDGMTYTASNNTATHTLMNAAGCDSIVTLDLTIITPTTSSVSATACSSYTWAQNGMTYTASGAYNDTIPNAAGCDSIITLNLTINMPATGIDVQTACGSYTWIDGNTYTASNNTATHTIAGGAANGCDSIVTLNLTINAVPNAVATDNGNATLTASAGASYQWINCTTGLAVSGATAQTFAPSANGSYAVVVTNASGCSDTSACVVINNVGVKELASEYIAVFPNPTHDDVTITMTSATATVKVVDGQGKVLNTLVVTNGSTISLAEYATGIYFLNITTETGTQLVRIAKN